MKKLKKDELISLVVASQAAKVVKNSLVEEGECAKVTCLRKRKNSCSKPTQQAETEVEDEEEDEEDFKKSQVKKNKYQFI